MLKNTFGEFSIENAALSLSRRILSASLRWLMYSEMWALWSFIQLLKVDLGMPKLSQNFEAEQLRWLYLYIIEMTKRTEYGLYGMIISGRMACVRRERLPFLITRITVMEFSTHLFDSKDIRQRE